LNANPGGKLGREHSNAKQLSIVLVLNRAVIFAWTGFAVVVVASFVIWFFNILHPSWVWMGATLPIFIVAELVGAVMVGLALYRGPRWGAVTRGGLLLIPLLVLTAPLILGSYRRFADG